MNVPPDIRVVSAPEFREFPENPARVYFDSNMIEINRAAYDKLPEYVKDFIIRHEIGHLRTNSANEHKADEYAIENSDAKDAESLVKALKSVNYLAAQNSKRRDSAHLKILTVAARRGSKLAKKALGEISNAKDKEKEDIWQTALFCAVLLTIGIVTIYIVNKK